MSFLTSMTPRAYTHAELMVIAKYAGEIPVAEIVEMVNKISKFTRSENSVVIVGRKHGFTFGLRAKA